MTLWPVEVAYAGFESTDRYDFLDGMPGVATVLRIRIESLGGSLRELDLRRLRFYLDGEMRTAAALYELLFAHATRVAVLPEGASRGVLLPQPALLPVGLGADEEVLPYPPHSHPGYRLLQEYFTAPRKFLFFDADHLDAHRLGKALRPADPAGPAAAGPPGGGPAQLPAGVHAGGEPVPPHHGAHPPAPPRRRVPAGAGRAPRADHGDPLHPARLRHLGPRTTRRR